MITLNMPKMTLFLIFISIAPKTNAGESYRKCMGRILDIYEIKCYVIIKAMDIANKKTLTILSPLDSTEANTICNSKGKAIKIGSTYTFYLKESSRFKINEKQYMFVSMKDLYINNKHILNAGELPFISLNSQGYFLCRQ